MLALISFFLLIFSIYIIKDKAKCLALYLMAISLFNNNFSLGPLHTQLLFTIALFIVFLRSYEKYKRNGFYGYPFMKVFVFFMISLIFVGLFDDRHTVLSTIVNPIKYLFQTFLLLFLVYNLSFNKTDSINFKNTIVVLLLIEFGFGIFEAVTSYNPIKELSASIFTDEEYQLLSDNFGRYRITSIQDSAFTYGYFSSILGLMLLYYSKISKRKDSKLMIFAIVAGFGGAVLSGSRSAMFACGLSYALFILTCYKMRNLAKLFVLLIPVTIVLLNISGGMFDELFQSFYDGITTGGKNSVGSSSDMRMEQWLAVLKYFSAAPILGNGFFYFVQVIGWGSDNYVHTDLWGLEGLHYSVLLEQGIIGAISHILMFTAIIKYFIKNKQTFHDESYLGLSLMTLFLTWSLLTGALLAWNPTMFFLAITLSNIQKRKYEASNSNTSL